MQRRTSGPLVAAIVAAHIVCVLAAGLFPVAYTVNDTIDDLFPALLAVSQMSLLSLWLVFGRLAWWLRTSVVIAAGAWLVLLVQCAEEGGWPQWGIIAAFTVGVNGSVMACVTIPALVARRRGWEVYSSNDAEPVTDNRSLQFSLGRLMAWVLTLSVLMAIARVLAGWSTNWSQTAAMTTVAVMMGVICGSIALMSLWASLAEGRPLRRIAIVVALAAVGGFMAGYATGGARSWVAWLLIAAVMAAVAIVINATLLGIRRAGFRAVVRRREIAAPAMPVSVRETALSDPA